MFMGKKSRAKNVKGTIARLWGYLKRDFRLLTFVSLLVLAGSAMQVAGPVLTGKAIDRDIRRNVACDVCLPADHGILADAAELVDPHGSRQVGPIPHGNVTGEHDVIGHDRVVSHATIMGHVRIHHNEIAIADDR